MRWAEGWGVKREPSGGSGVKRAPGLSQGVGGQGRRQNSLAAAPIISSQLQPTYIGNLYIAFECCSILAAASSYLFEERTCNWP